VGSEAFPKTWSQTKGKKKKRSGKRGWGWGKKETLGKRNWGKPGRGGKKRRIESGGKTTGRRTVRPSTGKPLLQFQKDL